ncbi:rotatin-like isoform X1 [Littorina saxatilis]|uniref:rotatin-like isoform X1 n=1 Tax=Littorina saxatilis TaxID=31220 RepID=UPI0038B666A6
MVDTCRFVLQANSKALQPEEVLALADSAVTSLPYHLHLNLITQFVAFFSHVSSRKSSDKSIQARCAGVLLKLLSHPLLEVRQHTYQTLLTTIQTCLNADKEAASGSYTGHLEAKFILNSDILYEITCFGLADPDNKVSNLAMELLFHLLQSHLLLGDILWGELMSSLLKSLPILHSYTDMKTRFGRRVWTMLDPTVASDSLCLLDKLRGNLRLMFSAEAGLRDEAVKRLCWFLANESGGSGRLPNSGQLDPRQLPSLFIMETQHFLDEDNTRSVFQVDGLKQVYNIFTADPVDPGVKKSAADQMAIMLQDPHLHGAFRESGGLEVVLSTLRQSMNAPSRTEHQNPNIPVVPACVTMLRHLLHHDYTLRHNLSHDPNVYYDLLRVSLMLVRDESVSYQVSHILTLLLFDEVAKFDISSSQKDQADRNFSLPAVITKRYRLPFRPTVHHTVSPNSVLSPPEHDILKTAAPQEMLRVAWNVAWCGGLDNLLQLLKAGGAKLDQLRDFNKAMVLTPTDRAVVKATGLQWGLQEGVYAVANATSHHDVVAGLTGILSVTATIPSSECADLVNQLNWTAVLDRFLQVTPSSSQDESLLLEVLRFMNSIIQLSASIPDEMAQWLAQRLYDGTGPLVGLLNRTPGGGEGDEVADASTIVKRSLDKVLLKFISTFISRLPYKLHTRLSVAQSRGDLARRLLLRLNISAAPHFYNLAALEGTLLCLMHLTARPGWSAESGDMEPTAQCSHVLNCLLEVVSAFHIGRGSTSMSYMGRGVTKAATLCLRHLAHEMVSCTDDKEWAKNWLYSRQGADAVAEPGLNWMLTLWAYRDAEVRAAGLGIAVALTSTEVGRVLVTNNCKHIPGGIWGAAFSVLLDPSECSIVRQQAALLLVNLTSETIPSTTGDATSASVWQGPVVTDVDSNVSLVGLNALLALLHHSHFYPQLSAMLSSFFPSTVLQPVLVTTEVPLHSLDSSQTTVTSTEGSTTPRGRDFLGQPSLHTTDQEGGATSARSTGRSNYTRVSQQDSQVSVTSSSSGTTRTGLQLDSSAAPSSQDGGAGGDEKGMTTVVTPCLVAAVSQLLGNLVVMAPHDTFNSLASHNVINTLLNMIDTSLLQDLCRQLTSGPHRSGSMLTLRDLLRMYNAIVSLVATSVKLNSPTRAALLGNKVALKAIASLMLLQCDSAGDLVLECRQLWLSVLRLLCTLLQTQSAAALLSLTDVLASIWIDFCDALVHLVEVRSGETQALFTTVTSFLSLLLTEEAKLVCRDPQRCDDTATLTHCLDVSKAKNKPAVEKGKDTGTFTTGSSLSKVLVGTYELTSGSTVGSKGRVSGDAQQVINTLKSLLAVSQSAKHTALDMGLVETLLETMKQTHARLSLDSLQVGKTSRRKDEGLLQELILTMNILRNLLCGNENVKLACMHSGLAGVVHKLWAWCLQDYSLMSAALALLLNFTAKCPAAATSIASTVSGAVGPSASRQQQISSSLVLAIVKATQREIDRDMMPSSAVGPGPSVSHLKLLFSLLTSLSLSSECRTLLWKSTFLQDFSKLSPSRSRKSRSRQVLDALWFELAVGLSFSSDGQQMLLRINECLTVLLDFVENGGGSPHCQEYAMLVLRNMCCHATNKPKLLANENVIPSCVDLVESAESSRLQILAASALWALAYNNHKAKMAMKGVNVIPRMRACLKNVQNLGHSMEDVQCSENIQAVISTVST